MLIEIILTLVVLLAGFLWHMKRHFSVFKRLGIPGPEPSIISGNLMEIMKKGQFQATVDWSKKYGRIFGYFEGYTPVMSVSDPDLLKQILVKDFKNFQCRKQFPLAPRKSLGLFLENGQQWKRSRNLLTPAFSSGKMKQMFPIITDTADILIDNLEKKAASGESFDIYSTFQCLTLDVIGRCAFGLRTDAQTDPNDPFLNNIRTLFNTLSKTLILPLVMFLPFLSYVVFFLKNLVVIFGMNPVVWLRNQMKEVITIRKEMGENSNIVDLVQMMLFPDKARGNENDPLKKPMTDREVVAQSMTFLLAGYETTSTVLAFFSHILAVHPDVHKKLTSEIEKKVGQSDITYNSVQNLNYFDMVFDEVCRFYPTASLIVTRRAAKTKTYNGVTIPADMNVHANVWALHHDEEFWESPETFDPERFSNEKKSATAGYTFLPFGAGPRACIGMRFAILEAKITLAKILQKFTIQKAEDTKLNLQLEARGAIVPKEEVKVKLMRKSCDAGNRRRG
ncbi:cytochrome P450 3A11-like [Haliotis asinina]|uniref:cytochrome P450 3A11-like n=1 Tax=Haliotis asinina TaxID=109174 RepID=UPI003532141F